MHCILWSPLCSISKFSLIKILLETIRFLQKLFPFMRRSIFSFEKQVFQFLKLWSRPKGGPHALHPLVPPLLHFKIFTHQNVARNHPILTKTGFQFLKLWSRHALHPLVPPLLHFKISLIKILGGPHALHPLVPPLLHFKIFTHQNLARNHPILTKTVSFHEKKHFFI